MIIMTLWVAIIIIQYVEYDLTTNRVSPIPSIHCAGSHHVHTHQGVT